MSQLALPTEPQSAATIDTDPLSARMLIVGAPKSGKTTCAAAWAPQSTLFLDLQHGTDLLPGEHFVLHIESWDMFQQAVDRIASGYDPATRLVDGRFRTIAIDTIDLVYKFADAQAGAKFGQVAAGLADFGKGTAEAGGLFRRAVGRLLACRGLGIVFIGHSDMVDDNGRQKLIPALDKRVRTYVTGEVEHQLVAEKIGQRTVLHTRGSHRFEAGSRLPLPEQMDLDARALYAAMADGIKQLKGGQTADTTTAAASAEED